MLHDELEDLSHLGRHGPGSVNIVDLKFPNRRIDVNHDSVLARKRLYHHLGNLLLNRVQSREQHLLGLNAGWIHVGVMNPQQRLVEGI